MRQYSSTCLRASLDQLNEVRHHVDRAVPLADLLVEAAEGIERALLVAVERQHVVVGLDRAIDFLELLFVDRGPSRRTARCASPHRPSP